MSPNLSPARFASENVLRRQVTWSQQFESVQILRQSSVGSHEIEHFLLYYSDVFSSFKHCGRQFL